MTMKIDFSFPSEFGTFCDALNLSDDHGLTDAELDAMKKARFDAWYLIVSTPVLDDTTVEE
jgi:hypothetical protein